MACSCPVTQSCLTPCDRMDCSLPRLLCPWDSPGKDTGVGFQALLQEILEWASRPSSRGSSRPRD